MKILQVCQHFKPIWESGGVARVVFDLSNGLVGNGHKLTIYTTNMKRNKNDLPINVPLIQDGMTVYYFDNLRRFFPTKYFLPLAIPYLLPHTLKKHINDFDIIHIHEHRTLLAQIVAKMAYENGIPYILQSHGSAPRVNGKVLAKTVFDNIFGNNIILNASKVIALSHVEKEQYLSMGISTKKIEIIPNGINPMDFCILPEMGTFRSVYSIPISKKIILYLGRLNKIKGIDVLINSCSELFKEYDGILVIVGPDDGYLIDLKKQIELLGMEKDTLITGPLIGQDKLAAYVDADVYVLPSRYETFPLTVMEAWACGTPVIVTRNCGISDMVDQCGLVAECDKDHLKEAINLIISNKELRHKYGSNGRGKVLKRLTLDNSVSQIENLYLKAIAEGSSR